MKYDVFISYSRKDTKVANRICEAFDNVGITYFVDRQGIGGGLEFPDVLSSAILDSELFLFLASKNSYESKFTNSEVFYAFNKKDKGKLVPYVIDSSSLPDSLDLVFSTINRRNIKDHPVETILIDDILHLLKRKRPVKTSDSIPKKRTESPLLKAEAKKDKYRPGNIFSFKGTMGRLQFTCTFFLSVLLAIGPFCYYEDSGWKWIDIAPVATQAILIFFYIVELILLIWILLAADAKRSHACEQPNIIETLIKWPKELLLLFKRNKVAFIFVAPITIGSFPFIIFIRIFSMMVLNDETVRIMNSNYFLQL